MRGHNLAIVATLAEDAEAVLFIANARTGAGIPSSNLEQLATLFTLRSASTTASEEPMLSTKA
jgi:hypothetical protein